MRKLLLSVAFSILCMAGSRPCLAQTGFATCADVAPGDPADSTAVAAPLTPLPNDTYRVEVHFLSDFVGDTTSTWTEPEKQYICAAALHFGQVLSSREFLDAALHLPNLVLNRYGFWHNHVDTIKGTDLYRNLTRQNVIVMELAIGNKHIQCARSVIADQGPTKLDKDYVDGPKKACGGPLLAALTNTLAHEYTHYNSRYISYDNDVVNDMTYVSYGIGCLVQNLAFQNKTCSYDPRTPPSAPEE